MSKTNLSPTQARWLRYEVLEFVERQRNRGDSGLVPQTTPYKTRQALISRGMVEEKCIEGIGGIFRYYEPTRKAVDWWVADLKFPKACRGIGQNGR